MADALLVKLGEPGQKAEMPVATGPAVQASETQSSRAMTALGTDPLPIDGLDSYNEICAKATVIHATYVLAGTAGTAGAARAQKAEANLKQHFDQMFTPLLFSAHCTAAHTPFIEGPGRKKDLAAAPCGNICSVV